MTKKTYVSIEDFKQLEQRLESLLKAFRGSHEAGKMSRQKIEMLEDNVNKCNQKICNLEEICENLKENQKYSILTEGEYDIDDIKEENIVNLDSKKLKHKRIRMKMKLVIWKIR